MHKGELCVVGGGMAGLCCAVAAARHAIERFIRPEEIAEPIYYLLSDYGEIICGHTVVADGGDNAATY